MPSRPSQATTGPNASPKAVTHRNPRSRTGGYSTDADSNSTFYSYDFLENLVGCDIDSADRIGPGWQDVEAGDRVRLAPQVALGVAVAERGKSLVLRGGVPTRNTPPPYDFTWAFVLNDAPGGATRLLVRERYACTRPQARVLVEPVEAVSFVMSQKMLRGIRDRAERAAAQPGST